jgi:hypothetical protein
MAHYIAEQAKLFDEYSELKRSMEPKLVVASRELVQVANIFK